MKTFLTILIVLAVAGYNIWVFFENKDIDEYNDALDNYNKGLYEKSLPVAQRLCEEKDFASACNLLAIHYENGHAVAKNETKAFELYKKGCDGGDKESACYNLALNYLDGIGVEQNINKAKEMLDELCSGILDKNKDACDMLAKLENKPQESKKQNAGATQNYNTLQNLNTQAQKEQIIKDLYAKYMTNQEPNQPLLALLSKDTKMLWDKAENNDDGMICLEFDPVIDGQDWNAKELEKTLKISSLPNGNVLAQFANFKEKKQVEYSFICDEKCTIDDLFINNQDGRFALRETLKSCLAETQNEANDPLKNLLKQADEMDKKLNEYYKQIMKGLEGEKKDKFKNAQRAWIKFATAAEETRQSPAHLLNARLSILEIQVNFLKAVIDGKTPKVADNESVKYYENEIAQFLQNINNLADYQRQSVSEANKAWSQYAKLKKDAATMMGLDGDEIYRGECKFWAEFLSYIN